MVNLVGRLTSRSADPSVRTFRVGTRGCRRWPSSASSCRSSGPTRCRHQQLARRTRPRRRSSRPGPPPSFYPGPGLLLPHLDGAVVPLDGPARPHLARPAAAAQQVPDPGDGVPHPEPPGHPGHGPGPASTAGHRIRRPAARPPAPTPARLAAAAHPAGTAPPAPSMPARPGRWPATPAASAAPTARSPAAQQQSPQRAPTARTSPRPPAGPAPGACGPRQLNRHLAGTSHLLHTPGNPSAPRTSRIKEL